MRDPKLVTEAKNTHRIINQNPKKSLGQNFLVDPQALKQIAQLGEITKGQEIVEIGPGLGWLSSELLKFFPNLTVVEKDDQLAKMLREKFGSTIQIIHGDILDNEIIDKLPENFKIIANIPYSITTPLIQSIITSPKKILRIIILVQKEVAERLSAPSGKSYRAALTVALEYYGKVSTDIIIAPTSFWPAPNVESQILIIEPYPNKTIEKDFIDFLYKGFRQKRKKLKNSISEGLSWNKLKVEELLANVKINENLRPEDLTVSQWRELWQRVEKMS